MIRDLLNNPDLKKYLHSFDDGHRLFLEGDTSQDLFILVSGRLDILKGGKKIAEIVNPLK